MIERLNNNCDSVEAAVPAAGDTPATTDDMIRHLYIHIPFCARICPYCAFYKDLLDRSQTERFCEGIVREIEQHILRLDIAPRTIFFGGGTPTALPTAHLEFLLGGFHQLLDLSAPSEWTIEPN